MIGRVVKRRSASDYPFPQADSPVRILDVLEIVCRGPLDDKKLADELGHADGKPLHTRQGRYYADAAAYLGLIRFSAGYYRPTNKGVELNEMVDVLARREAIGRMVVALPVFEQAAKHLAAYGELPPMEEIADWIQAEDAAVNEVTALRRARTVHSWIGAVAEATPDVVIELQVAAAPGMVA